MFYGKLPHDLEHSPQYQALGRLLSPDDYDHAVLMMHRFRMQCGMGSSDGTLMVGDALTLYRRNRKRARRLLRALVDAGLLTRTETHVTDPAFETLYDTRATIARKRAEARQRMAARRLADACVGACQASPEARSGPSEAPSVAPERPPCFEQYQQLRSDCSRELRSIDLDLTARTSTGGAQRTPAESSPATKITHSVESNRSSVPGPRQPALVEDLQAWAMKHGRCIQLTGKQTALANKLIGATEVEKAAAVAAATEWAARDGVPVTAGRLLKCLSDYKASYAREMARSMSVGLAPMKTQSRATSRVTDTILRGHAKLKAALAAGELDGRR